MKNALIGIFCALVVIALLFGYSSSFDYTYDGKEYGVDFETPTQLNSSKIQSSFNKVYYYAHKLTSFVSDTVSDTIATFSNEVNTDDADFDVFYNELRERSLVYITENHSFWTRWWYKNQLNQFTDVLHGYQKIIWFEMPVYGTTEDIKDLAKNFGWTDEETERIHQFMVDHEIHHVYDGQVFSFE